MIYKELLDKMRPKRMMALKEAEREYWAKLIVAERGNYSSMALVSGVSRSTVYRLVKKFELTELLNQEKSLKKRSGEIYSG